MRYILPPLPSPSNTPYDCHVIYINITALSRGLSREDCVGHLEFRKSTRRQNG